MKLLRSIQKNLKILARSKGSALVVLLAPLIIVFIIGLGFMDNPELKLNIGTHVKEPTDLTTRYIQSFNTTEHNIIMYETEQQCVSSIRDGITVMCVVFSEDFEIRDEAKNELTFYVDESRINLVDRLISSFSTTMGTESSDISEELAEQLINIIEVSYKQAQDSLALTIINRAQINNANTQTSTALNTITDMDTKKESINLLTLEARMEDVEDDFVELRARATDAVNKAKNIIPILEEEGGTNVTEFISSLNNLNTTLNNEDLLKNLNDLEKAVNSLSISINKLTERIEKAGTAKTTTTNNLNEINNALETITTNTDQIKTKQEQILTEIESFELRSARSITSPITTKIESVSAPSNRLTYSFSYLLTLAILFIGLMLSSTLVFMEKDSKSFFRNFTTPTTQKYFTFINYLTALIIIIIQTLLILAIAHFTLNVPILTNPEVTMAFLFIGITLFITIGLLIGTLASTSEAVTMSTIVIGSVLMFLSNLILPLETLSPIMSKIAELNPYVIVSEGIRKAMLFGAGFEQLYSDLIILMSYTAILITIMIVINQIGFKHYLASRRHKKNLLITEPENLTIEIKGTITQIRNTEELLKTLKKMTQEDYEKITKPKNQITFWLKQTLKQKALARKIKNKTLTETINKIEQYLNQEKQKQEKKKHKQQKKQQKKQEAKTKNKQEPHNKKEEHKKEEPQKTPETEPTYSEYK
ncbi:ABC transporter permease [Candidatus Woesearchaeota archaeon]|nr:ABC transporter permease [Candidatus Woesearchaeota archaeon]